MTNVADVETRRQTGSILLVTVASGFLLGLASYLWIDTSGETLPRVLRSFLFIPSLVSLVAAVVAWWYVAKPVSRFGRLLRLWRDPHGAEVPWYPEVFVGRSREVANLANAAENLAAPPFVVCLYGFAGVGKSRLLREFYYHLESRHPAGKVRYRSLPRVALSDVAQTAGLVSIPSVLCDIMNVPHSQADHPQDKLERVIRFIDGFVILLDEFPVQDPEAVRQLQFLAVEAESRGAKCLVVTTSRAEPAISDRRRIATMEVKAMPEPDLREYVTKGSWPSNEVVAEVLANFGTFYEHVRGIPQVARYALCNLNSWTAYLAAGHRIFELDDVAPLLEEVWSTLPLQECRDALKTLAVVTSVSPEWLPSVGTGLLDNWVAIRRQLIARGLLSRLPSGRFKVHDLLAEFVYANIPSPEDVHARICTFYRTRRDEPELLILAAVHATRARRIDLFEEAYPPVAAHLSAVGDMRTLRSILEDAAALTRECAPLFRVRCMRDKARVLLRLGETNDALAEYKRTNGILHNLTASDPTEEAEILEGMADCYRLTGRLQMARDAFHTALELYEKSGLIEQAFRARIEYGHSYFLAGELEQSLAIYHQVEGALSDDDHPQIAAGLYYRKSKTHRLLGDYSMALAESEKAKTLYEQMGDRSGVGQALWARASTLRMEGKYDEARRLCTDVQKLFEETGYRASVFLQHDVAEIHRACGEFDKALAVYEDTLTRVRLRGEENRTAHSYLGLAETIRWRAQSESRENAAFAENARSFYDSALEIYERMEMKWGQVACLVGLGLAYLAYPETAGRFFSRAKQITEGERMPVEDGVIDVARLSGKPVLFPLNWI